MLIISGTVNLTGFDSISYFSISPQQAQHSTTQDTPGRGVLGRCWSHKKDPVLSRLRS
jgi:hypothetical protein